MFAVGSTITILAEKGDDLSSAVEIATSAAKEASSVPSPREKKTLEALKASEPSKEPSSPSLESKAELLKGDCIFASPIAKKKAFGVWNPFGSGQGHWS